MKDLMRTGPLVLKTVIVSFVLIITVSISVDAELYRYTDEKGAVRYTDELAVVPVDQRPNVKTLMTRGRPAPKAPMADKAAGEDAPKETVTSPEDDLRKLEFERLSQEKKMLDEEFGELMKTKESLNENKEQLDAKTYNEQANQLNERIAAYEEKREAFKKAADAFNAQINEKNGKNEKSEKEG